ncbi:MAG: autotransporter outer membrane beta-barrel domain-containing protein [Martelella sp.]
MARPAAGVRPDAAYNDAYNTLYAADLDALAAGLPSMTGQLHAEIGTSAVRAVGRFADAVGTRQMQLTNGLAGTGDRSAGEGTLWASGNSLSTSVGSANGLSGYDVSGGNGVFGYDWRFGQGVAGVAASYEYADVSANANGSGDVGTYQAALYGSFDAGMMTFAGRAGLGYGDLSTSRITTLGAYSATASASGHGTGGFIEAAAFSDLDMDAFTLTPSATLGYRAFHRDSMQESGSNFALAIPSETFDETQTTLAVALSKDISFDNGVRLLPAISAGWRHDYGDTGRSSTLGIFGSDFDVAGADIGADAFIGRVSVTAFADDRFTFEAAYEGEFRENLESHMFSAKASLSF